MNWKSYKTGGYKLHSEPYKSSSTTVKIFNYKNKRKSNFLEKFKIKFLIISLIFLTIFIIYLLFFSKLFLIKTIEVRGNQTINTQEIKDIAQEHMFRSRFIIFNQQNRFFIDKNTLIADLSSRYKLSNIFLNVGIATITINIEENESAIIWKTNEDSYYLDLNGIIIKKISETDLTLTNDRPETDNSREKNQFPIISDNGNDSVWIGKKAIEPEEINFILNLSDQLKDIKLFKIKNYKIDDKWVNEVRVETELGWEVYFNTKDDTSTQINNLVVLLNEKLKDRSKLNYIDLRFGNRVYYK